MKERPLILPECKHHLDMYSISKKDLKDSYEKSESLTGKVTDIDVARRVVKVKLAEKVWVDMDWEDSCLETLTYKSKKNPEIPDQVAAILNRKIRCKVKEINGNDVYVSRKLNMEEAWNYIIALPEDYIFDATVVSINRNATMVFYDIGEGITGFCYYKDFSFTRIRLNEWCKYGQTHQVRRIHEFDHEHYSARCSRKAACKRDYSDFRKYDIVYVVVGDQVFDECGAITGYYVEVNPLVRGILDLTESTKRISYGDVVRACVKRVAPEKKKMTLSLIHI